MTTPHQFRASHRSRPINNVLDAALASLAILPSPFWRSSGTATGDSINYPQLPLDHPHNLAITIPFLYNSAATDGILASLTAEERQDAQLQWGLGADRPTGTVDLILPKSMWTQPRGAQLALARELSLATGQGDMPDYQSHTEIMARTRQAEMAFEVDGTGGADIVPGSELESSETKSSVEEIGIDLSKLTVSARSTATAASTGFGSTPAAESAEAHAESREDLEGPQLAAVDEVEESDVAQSATKGVDVTTQPSPPQVATPSSISIPHSPLPSPHGFSELSPAALELARRTDEAVQDDSPFSPKSLDLFGPATSDDDWNIPDQSFNIDEAFHHAPTSPTSPASPAHSPRSSFPPSKSVTCAACLTSGHTSCDAQIVTFRNACAPCRRARIRCDIPEIYAFDIYRASLVRRHQTLLWAVIIDREEVLGIRDAAGRALYDRVRTFQQLNRLFDNEGAGAEYGLEDEDLFFARAREFGMYRLEDRREEWIVKLREAEGYRAELRDVTAVEWVQERQRRRQAEAQAEAQA